MANKKSVRLPSYVKPQRYALVIKPDLKKFTFEGSETIFLTLEKSVRDITLHSKELSIKQVGFVNDRRKVKVKKISYDEKSETATFTFEEDLPKGEGELRLTFEGILNDKMRGFYRSRYLHNGREKHMATTQFEATDARRAFPCFDEPAHKAIFDVTLIVPKSLTAISNTIETEVAEHQGGYKAVKFAPSPKMSTYLLAFIVGDFEFIEAKTKDNVLVRVFVTPGKKHQAKFALDTAVRALEFYNKYFAIPYPLPVLDLIAIPDFSHGAMENWGAVTYRESALLVDPNHSSASNKQWVALVIAHELAHQWFGNLVTMEWWTHLWLNEGFASYIEYLAVNELFPSWDIWTQFAYADLGVALKLDGLKNTHPIEVEVDHPDEIGEIFDEISYSKGASVIRMLAGFLGEKDFRDGLRHYLKKHSYQNASTLHLWEAFEKVSGKPVRKMMQNWTAQPGYPVLKLQKLAGDGKKIQVKLSQQRFYSSPISAKSSSDNTLWQVPIIAQSSADGKASRYLLQERQKLLTILAADKLKINIGETGFFRTQYDSYFLNKLAAPIAAKKLSPIDRLGVIRDAFALAEAGDLPTTEVLKLLEAYKQETDYTVWVEICSGLSVLRNLFYDQNFYGEFKNYSILVLNKIASKVGWQAQKNEGHVGGLLRSLILHQLIAFEDEASLAKGKQIFAKTKSIAPDIRSVAYQAVAQTGGEKVYNSFIKSYKKETLSEEKNRLGRALGQFSSPKLLQNTLKFAMSKDVRIQDTPQIFMSVWANPKGKNLAWQFVCSNWKQLLKKYPASGHMLNRFIKPASGFISSANAKNLQNFFKTHPEPSINMALNQVLEKIYSNEAWLKRDGKLVEKWLRNNV